MKSRPESLIRYKLKLCYDGSSFCGWQVQPNGISIQQLLNKALSTILQQPVTVTGSGRTDSGVHALGQVAHFDALNIPDHDLLIYRLNAMLPSTIRVLSLEKTTPTFHACYHAVTKEYHYHIALGPIVSPFLAPYRYRPKGKVDLAILKAASLHMLGTHDFTSFANEATKGAAAVDPVRTLMRIDIVPEEGGVRLEFEGDGFLYQQVRNMVGTLIECSLGKRTPESLPALFEAKDRRKAGFAAPPHALFLVKVTY